jgi:hypothetical protein
MHCYPKKFDNALKFVFNQTAAKENTKISIAIADDNMLLLNNNINSSQQEEFLHHDCFKPLYSFDGSNRNIKFKFLVTCTVRRYETTKIPEICIETVPDSAIIEGEEENGSETSKISNGDEFVMVEKNESSSGKSEEADEEFQPQRNDIAGSEIIEEMDALTVLEGKGDDEHTMGSETLQAILVDNQEKPEEIDDIQVKILPDDEDKAAADRRKKNLIVAEVLEKLATKKDEDLRTINWLSLASASKTSKDNWGRLLAQHAKISNFYEIFLVGHFLDFELQKQIVVDNFMAKQNYKELTESTEWNKLKENRELHEEVLEKLLKHFMHK